MDRAEPRWIIVSRLVLANIWFKAAAFACALGWLINATTRSNGYYAGDGDQLVLSPLGMHWADPTAFAGDWFLENAPQPHWFFDLLTFLGATHGSIGTVYLLFWFVGLYAFGLATSLLAQHWTPRFTWVAGLALVVVASQSPWQVVGTGTSMIASAIPATVGANLVYLAITLLIVGRHRALLPIAVIIAVVHVQQGAVIAVILAVTMMVESIRRRRLAKWLLAGFLATASITVLGLLLRPIAASPTDFVEVCNTIIPFHCDANSWGGTYVAASIGFIALSALTWLLTARSQRVLWLSSVGLAAFGLLAGLTVDLLDIPVLGELAQASNVYRLGADLLPFAMWGILLPFFMAARSTRTTLLTLAIWMPAVGAFLIGGQWGFKNSALTVAILLIILAVGASIARRIVGSDDTSVGIIRTAFIVTAAALVMVSSAASGATLIARPLNPTFFEKPGLKAWGEEVRELVPVGEVIVAQPDATYVRFSTMRPVIADCKNVPYGGEAWTEWNERISMLGTIDQCRGLDAYSSFTAAQLVDIADTYDSDYVLISTPLEGTTGTGLEEYGWHPILEPHPNSYDFTLYTRDSA